MSHMTHRQKQAAAKAAKQQQMAADARRIAFDSTQHDENRAYEQARRRQDAANDSRSTLDPVATLFFTLLFVAGVLWLLQDDNSDPNIIHCIGQYYQPIDTYNRADCRTTGLGGH